MTKKFKAKNIDKLDNPLRRRILPPDRVISIINLRKGQYVADVGCGIGYFTIPMAKSVGEEGKVYAIDINPLMVEETKKRVENEKLINVDFVHSAENNFRIEDNSVDMVFTSTVFHELDSPEKFLEECKRVLKDKGAIVILDWNKIEEEIGPPVHKRIDVEIVKEYIIKAGLSIKEVSYIGESFYVLVSNYKGEF